MDTSAVAFIAADTDTYTETDTERRHSAGATTIHSVEQSTDECCAKYMVDTRREGEPGEHRPSPPSGGASDAVTPLGCTRQPECVRERARE